MPESACLRLRRLWHAVRRPCGDCPPSRGGRPGRRPVLGDLAHQAARICLDALGGGALPGLLDADRARARPCVRARALGRQGAARDAARRLFQARRIPRRARGTDRPEGQGPEDRDPVERQPDDAVRRRRGREDRRRSRRGALGRRDPHLQAAPGGLCAGHRGVRRDAGRGGVRVVEPLGRDGRGVVRIQVRVGQSRRHAGGVSGVRAGAGGAGPGALGAT